MKTFRPYRPIALALALLAVPASASAGDWSWNLTPYAWLPEVTGDVQVNDQEVIGGQISAKDLLDDADFALMAHLEGRRGKTGIFADIVFGDFGDEPRDFGLGPIPITAESDLELTLLDVGGVWSPSEDGGFGIHYGLRLIDVDQEIDTRLVGPFPTTRRIYEISRSEVDGLLGFRYLSKSSTRWSFGAWGDISAGGSDGSWNAFLVAGYHFGSRDQYAVRVGYRHMEIELGDEDRAARVETDIVLSGPLVGFTFGF